MILIMAIWMKAAALWAYRSKSLAIRLFALIQASVRSTIQRLGRTTKPFAVSERRTISTGLGAACLTLSPA